ncbi:unnamed protein product [Symbiodinium necroappetens]|uniref:Uncharacterized protein n=1 Tax=Symbiodinium necroappetens TaxID=1628268 RepID=A0A813B6A1_9DINO|nr:unnamed protein product [Symbiodinium necroappetens]
MSASPEFRRGAMQLAGSVPARCRVIATYLEPPDLPAQGSSTVCRFAMAMMLMDVGLLMTFDASDDAPATAAGLPRIRLPSGDWNGKARRLLATLRVKLGLFLVHIGLDQLHIPQDEKSDLRRTFRNIQDQLDKEGNLESKIIGALGSFSVALPGRDKQVSGALDLLLGIEDARAEDRRYPGVVSLDNRKLSLPLEMLLTVRDVKDESFNLFCDGQGLLVDSILGNSDWCDGLVMERAYAWVLLDVTGATNAGTCKVKAEQIAQNAAAVMNEAQMQNATVPVESVICVLLAPNCDSAIEEPPSAQVVQGDAARDLLGGLQQLLTWLGEDVD